MRTNRPFGEKIHALMQFGMDFILPRSDEAFALAGMTASDLAPHLRIRTLSHHVTALFEYQDERIRSLIWLLKYQKSTHAAELFATVLYEYILEHLAETKLFEGPNEPIIVPLPLSPRRIRERGYNQMELVLHALEKASEHTLTVKLQALQKIRHTRPQTKLNRKERLENVHDSFRANPGDVRGRTIILVDDVVTTGSTLLEAKRALMHAGAHSTIPIALAG